MVPKSTHFETDSARKVLEMYEVKMEDVLRIEVKKYVGESIVISSRIPKDMLQDIDFVAKSSGRTRNEIILKFLDFALKHTEIIDNTEGEK